jgi:phosphatidylglycerol lysyltransferase
VPPGQALNHSLWDVLSAFAGGRPFRFGWETVLRGPSWVLRLLAGLLLPWTALIALAPLPRWFPSPWIKWAWVSFDLLLCGALFALARRWRPHVGRALAIAVSADGLLTLVEALGYNARRAAGPGDWLVMAASVFAPTLASSLLWTWDQRHRASL